MPVSKVGIILLAILLAGCNKLVERRSPNPADLLNGVDAFVNASPEFRSYDGFGNNIIDPNLGKSMTPLKRFPFEYYSDGIGSPVGATYTDDYARRVSNAMNAAGNQTTKNSEGASDYLWVWGQFLDHDMDLTGPGANKNNFNIAIPRGDAYFDPQGTGTQEIPFTRSMFVTRNGIRSQVNEITSFIDASMVYGSDKNRSLALRKRVGGVLSAYMNTSEGELLPYNTNRLMNDPADDPHVDPTQLFLAGDVRANENAALTTMHTIFVREHNYIVDLIKARYPSLDTELLFETARAIVAAEIQAITFNEFLPILLGSHALPSYQGYNTGVDPSIHIMFSTAAFRVGHTMVSPFLLRNDINGDAIALGHLFLKDAFFQDVPNLLRQTGLNPFLRGLSAQEAQSIDVLVIDELRNFLFGPPGSGGFDLPALNIQRGRDHGLPLYNEARRQFGLLPYGSFDDITNDSGTKDRLRSIYTSPEAIDPWIGGLAESHVSGALVGPLFFTVIRDQFLRTRQGDRFWYQNYLPASLIQWVESSTLARIIRRNSQVGEELPGFVFLAD